MTLHDQSRRSLNSPTDATRLAHFYWSPHVPSSSLILPPFPSPLRLVPTWLLLPPASWPSRCGDMWQLTRSRWLEHLWVRDIISNISWNWSARVVLVGAFVPFPSASHWPLCDHVAGVALGRDCNKCSCCQCRLRVVYCDCFSVSSSGIWIWVRYVNSVTNDNYVMLDGEEQRPRSTIEKKNKNPMLLKWFYVAL